MKLIIERGCLITKALEGKFDVIAHGCNCMSIMGAGIALQMKNIFGANHFPMESRNIKPINKLGNIDYKDVGYHEYKSLTNYSGVPELIKWQKYCTLVNAYTQYQPGANLDYAALTLCMKKINHEFKGKHIGLPQIGCGIAGGDWNKVKQIIQSELKDCDVTIVIYEKS